MTSHIPRIPLGTYKWRRIGDFPLLRSSQFFLFDDFFIGLWSITADLQMKSVYLWSCWNTPLLMPTPQMLKSTDADSLMLIHWSWLSNADADQLKLPIQCWYLLVDADSPCCFQPMLIIHMRTLWSKLVHIIPDAEKHQPENNAKTSEKHPQRVRCHRFARITLYIFWGH